MPRFAVGLALWILVAAGPAAAQEIWQADVRIQTFEVAVGNGASISIRVVVASDQDDEAMAVRLAVLLPIGAEIERMTPGCRASPSPVPRLVARVSCDLGSLPVGSTREVSLSAEVPPSSTGVRRLVAFVESDTPDPMPQNNYAERAIP